MSANSNVYEAVKPNKPFINNHQRSIKQEMKKKHKFSRYKF